MNSFSYFKFMKWLFPFVFLGSSSPNVTIDAFGNIAVVFTSSINTLNIINGEANACDITGSQIQHIVSEKVGGLILRDLNNTTIDLSSATIVGGNTGREFYIYDSSISGTLDFPTLALPEDIYTLTLSNVTGLTGISWSGSMPGIVAAAGIASLQTLTFNSVIEMNTVSGENINFSGCGLNQASVDALLAKCAALAGAITVNVSGGTNATPSAAGLVSKATIISNGGSVTNN